MQLLPKNKLNSALQDQQSKEVEQGYHLARKVDALRETVAKEEQELRKFRESTLKIIQAEIESKHAELDNLKHEISIAESKRKKLVEPLLDEINKLENIKSGLEQERFYYRELMQGFKKEKDSIISERIKIGNEIKVLTDKKNMLDKRSLDISNKLNQAEGILAEANSYKTKVESDMHYLTLGIAKREEKILVHERNLELREASLKERERGFILKQRRYGNN